MEVFGWGEVRRIVVALPQPAAGAGASYVLPESQYSTVLAVAFRLVTSATAATRVPTVTITDGSGVAIVSVAAGKSQIATLTGDYSFVVGLGEWDAASTAVLSGPLPAFPLDGGDTIVIGVNAIDAADQLSRVRVTLLQRPVRDNGA